MAASACARISSCRRTVRRRTRPSSSFPAADAFRPADRAATCRSSGRTSSSASGRAFLYPVYKGTYERVDALTRQGPNAERELRIAWSRDLGRAIDYLETRSDIDRARLAFYGVSAGADAGVILTALEPRLKTSVLQGAGIWDDVGARNRSAQLCAAGAHTDADVEWPLRLRHAGRDGATPPVRPAGISARAQTAHGIRDRSRDCRSRMWPARFSPGSTAILDRSSTPHPRRLALRPRPTLIRRPSPPPPGHQILAVQGTQMASASAHKAVVRNRHAEDIRSPWPERLSAATTPGGPRGGPGGVSRRGWSGPPGCGACRSPGSARRR